MLIGLYTERLLKIHLGHPGKLDKRTHSNHKFNLIVLCYGFDVQGPKLQSCLLKVKKVLNSCPELSIDISTFTEFSGSAQYIWSNMSLIFPEYITTLDFINVIFVA